MLISQILYNNKKTAITYVITIFFNATRIQYSSYGLACFSQATTIEAELVLTKLLHNTILTSFKRTKRTN